MNLLALETSTDACSVALLTGQGEIYSEFELSPRQHTAYLPVMLERVLSRAGLPRSRVDAIAYTNGPGAFTGVRIAAAMAQGMALALDVSLVPVSTLAVLAQQASEQLNATNILAALDARMGEVYAGRFSLNAQTGLVRSTSTESLIKLQELTLPAEVYGVGSGLRARRQAGIVDEPDARIDDSIYPSARALARLAAAAVQQGLTCPADRADINYIRNRVAEKKQPK